MAITPNRTERIGGIVLCGGKSTRMGLAKATLPFGPERMLERVIRLLAEVVHPIVVVAAIGQSLPEVPNGVLLVRDERDDRGPLEGLAAGLAAIAPHADAAYATGCDVPLLQAEFVRYLIRSLGNYEVAVPVDGDFLHPLAAIYRVSVLGPIRSLLDADCLRPAYLYHRTPTRRVPVEDLRSSDQNLDTLRNLNRPDDYFAALKMSGFEVDPWVRVALKHQV